MLTAAQIIAILMLLQAFGAPASVVANVKIALTKSHQQTMTLNEAAQSPSNQTPQSEGDPQFLQSSPAGAPQVTGSVDVVNPIAGKGMRSGISVSGGLDAQGNPTNQIDFGAIVYDLDGNPLSTPEVMVTIARDGAEVDRKTIQGTGNMMTLYVNGEKRTVPYYPLHYEFTEPGDYNFEFWALGASAIAPIQVGE